MTNATVSTKERTMTATTVTRRDFLKASAAAGAAAGLFPAFRLGATPASAAEVFETPRAAEQVIRTACMMCNAGCGLQVRVSGGVATKIEGNPFCPHTNDWSAATRPTQASADLVAGRICGRGNGGLKTTYDPYRIMRPLKRTGPRGSGQWQEISWKQAFDEITAGSTLPGPSGGTYNFQGLTAIRGVPDAQGKAVETMAAADTSYAAEAKDGNAANFGLKANRYARLRGRDQISAITGRFNAGYGTKNHLEHSSICNTAWAGSMKYTFPHPKKAKYNYFRAELDNVDYLILMGTNPLEANVGTPYWVRNLMDFKARGGKLVVVDPFFTHTASKADTWIPVKPGHDGALVMGMIRWIIENGRHLADYLARPNEDAAQAGATKYYNWTDASFLVKLDANGEAEKYLDSKTETGAAVTTITATITSSAPTIPVAELGGLPTKGIVKIGSESIYYAGKSAAAGAGDLTGCVRGAMNSSAASATVGAEVVIPFVCRKTDGTVVPYGNIADTADLDWAGTTPGGKSAKTVFRLIKDAAMAKTVDEWAALAGVEAQVLKTVADEFSAAGKKSCLEAYRGAWGHTNGFTTALAVNGANILIGRVDRVGGYCTSARYGSSEPTRNVSVSTSGVRIDRVGSKYEGTLSTPTRQWYPLAGQASQEIIPSSAIGYPYKILAFFHYCSNPAYTYTNSQAQRDALVRFDSATGAYSIPLTFSATIFMDETAALADYILPDSSYLERYTTPFTGYPTVKTKSGTIRRPVIGTYRDITVNGRNARIYIPPTSSLNGNTFATQEDLIAGWQGPMPYDEQLIQLGKKLSLPNFGASGMKNPNGVLKDLDTSYQFWDEAFRWNSITGGSSTAPIVEGTGLGNEGASGAPGDSSSTYMQEGGRWNDPSVIEDSAKPGWAHGDFRYGDLITLFADKVAGYENKLLHHRYPAHAQWMEPGKTLKGNTQPVGGDYPYTMLTYKRAWLVQSRSTSNEWLRELQPEGFLYLNSSDASALGVRTGDTVRLTNRLGQTADGTARVIEGLRAGCVEVDHHFGRQWFGSQPYFVSGNGTTYDAAIGVGPDRNLVQAGDADFPDIGLTEPVSGQAVFYWDSVKVQKI